MLETAWWHLLPSKIRAPRLAPQDKACIDQNNIDQALACLPVFLAGCQTLLVVAGGTYCSRLWCCMELFTFVRSALLQFEHVVGTISLNIPLILLTSRVRDHEQRPRLPKCTQSNLRVCTQWAAPWSVSRFI